MNPSEGGQGKFEVVGVDDDDFDVDTDEGAMAKADLIGKRVRAGKVLKWTGIVQTAIILVLMLMFFREAYLVHEELEDFEPDGFVEALLAEVIITILVYEMMIFINIGILTGLIGSMFALLIAFGIMVEKGKSKRRTRKGLIVIAITGSVSAVLAGALAYLAYTGDSYVISIWSAIVALTLVLTSVIVISVLREIKPILATFEPDPPYPGAEKYLKSIDVEPRWKTDECYTAEEISSMRKQYYLNYPKAGRNLVKLSMLMIVVQAFICVLAVPSFPHMHFEMTDKDFQVSDLFDLPHYGVMEVLMVLFIIAQVLILVISIVSMVNGRKMANMVLSSKLGQIRAWLIVDVTLLISLGMMPLIFIWSDNQPLGFFLFFIVLIPLAVGSGFLMKPMNNLSILKNVLDKEGLKFHHLGSISNEK